MFHGILQEKRKAAPVKPPEMKRTRRDRGELEDIMFKLFERKPNWALKQLVQETDQPAVSFFLFNHVKSPSLRTMLLAFQWRWIYFWRFLCQGSSDRHDKWCSWSCMRPVSRSVWMTCPANHLKQYWGSNLFNFSNKKKICKNQFLISRKQLYLVKFSFKQLILITS